MFSRSNCMYVSTSISIDPKARHMIRLTMVWHVVLTLLGYIFFSVLLAGKFLNEIQGLLRIVLMIVVFLFCSTSAWAAVELFFCRLQGRTLSLAVNFLGFLAFLLLDLHFLGIFTGIDNLGSTFAKAIPALLGVAAGYFISTLSDRFEGNYDRAERFRQVGKWVALISFVIFLILAGIFQGLVVIFQQMVNFTPLILTLVSVLFALNVLNIWREPVAIALNANSYHKEAIDGYLFLSPNLLGFLLFFAGPLLFSLYVSFTDWDAFGNKRWIGLENYAKIFNLDVKQLQTPDQVVTEAVDTTVFDELTRFKIFGRDYLVAAQDKLFWISLGNTLLFCLLAVPLSVIPALLLSNVLNSKIPGMKFFRAVYFLPSIAATVGVSLIWQWLYNAAVGYINFFITSGVNFWNNLFGTALLDPQVRWLSDTRTALIAIVIMAAWQTMGYNTVLFLAGLQNIPKELYEAAVVDGAGAFRKFWNLTLPLLAPTTFFVLTTTTIQALQVFEQVFVMTNPPGGPNNSTLTLVLYLYQKGFQRFQQGYASATAWVLFLVIFGITLIQFQRQRNTQAYDT